MIPELILIAAVVANVLTGLRWVTYSWRDYTCDDETFDKIQKHLNESH